MIEDELQYYIRKRAAGPGAAALVTMPVKIVSDLVKGIWDVGKSAINEIAVPTVKTALPLSAVTAAILASKLTSPYSVAENAEDILINQVERESLAQSLRDLEELKQRKRREREATNKKRPHDQFV